MSSAPLRGTTGEVTTQARNFDNPNATIVVEGLEGRVVTFDDVSIVRATVQPGWRWSEVVKPTVETERCELAHTGLVLSGRLAVESRDGQRTELAPGDGYRIAPGHDAWVVGDELVEIIEFESGGVQAREWGVA